MPLDRTKAAVRVFPSWSQPRRRRSTATDPSRSPERHSLGCD